MFLHKSSPCRSDSWKSKALSKQGNLCCPRPCNQISMIHVLSALCCAIAICTTQANCASFYGLSYIKLPLQEAKNRTDVEFSFKTSQMNAFLFLAAGSSDYCLVFLENGQLAIKINFGSGETYLASDELEMNDLMLHKVKIQQINSQLTLRVDDKHSFVNKISGYSHELNIKYGIFLGGQDNFKSLYLGNLKPLRGCLDRVYFNQRDILAESLKHGIVHNVSPDCDEQFTDVPNTTLSFIHRNSFVVFPGLSSVLFRNQSKISIQLDIKTMSENAILLFNPSDNPYKRRYVVVELVKGRVKFSINDGSVEHSVHSSVPINSGRWHHLEMGFDQDSLQVVVDAKVETTQINNKRFAKASQHYSNEMFVGGISTTKQSTALNYGIKSVLIEQNVSLKGCVKNLRINSKYLSLFDAEATNRIKTGRCKWSFLCADQDKTPCIEDSNCIQQEVANIKCVCSQDHCVKSHFKHKTIVVRSEKLELCNRYLKNIDVLEGSSAIIRPDIFSNFDTENAEVEFRIIKKAKHGLLENMAMKNDDSNRIQTFNHDDLRRGLLRYTHDGSEHYNDSIMMQLIELNQQDSNNLITVLSDNCHNKMLILKINIRSSNDDPNKHRQQIKIKMIKNSKKLISHNSFKSKIKTSKKKNEDTVYRVIQVTNGDQSYFERTNKPNVPLKEFTESDLKSQSIIFVHVDKANHSDKVAPIQVTLHASSRNLAINNNNNNNNNNKKEIQLTIEPYEIDLIEVHNTGILLLYNTASLISVANLSFTNNIENDQSQLIKYEIISGPSYGIIQKLRSPSPKAPNANQWTNVSHFSQRQVERAKVRYIHLTGRPNDDKIDLKVSYNRVQAIRFVTFRIMFVHNLTIISSGLNHYNISENDREITIGKEEISFSTEPVQTIASEIILTLLSVPLGGSLYLIQSNGKQSKLHISSTFTQKNVDERDVLYVKNYSHPRDGIGSDSFDFEAAVIGSNITLVSTFHFNIKQTVQRYNLINNEISVAEGGKATIDENYLFFFSGVDPINDDSIIFNITKQPKYGQTQLLSSNSSKEIVEVLPRQFITKFLKQKQIVYVHDDSENEFDFFEFVVTNSSFKTIVSGKFSIKIELKNDNPPRRVIDKTFNIIRNGERRLLGSDIKYADSDINTPASSIVYTKTYIPSGNFYYINDTVAKTFSQEELNNGMIKFIHEGNDELRAILWITDGQFYLSGILNIKASDPYITIANYTKVIVKYGENCLITPSNLLVETNLDLTNKNDVLFKLTSEPKFGQILINEKSINQFTLQELEDEVVEYESTVFDDELSTSSKTDSFHFRIIYNNTAKDIRIIPITYEFVIQIYPQSYFSLNVVNLNNLTVFEEKMITIDSNVLLVEHSELKADDILYRIIEKPKYGIIKNMKEENIKELLKQDSQMEGTAFSQKDVNNGFVVYQNVKINSNESDPYLFTQFFDSFTYNVGNSIITLNNITCTIELIPKLITLITTNVTVTEGNKVILSNENLVVSHPYYAELVDELIVVEEPKFGKILLIGPDDIQLSAKSFTLEQLTDRKICYQQDSSEVDRDWFTIVARSNSIDKESLPATIHITVNSINDESPKIVNNSFVEVWKDSSVKITNFYLAATDEDSEPHEINYVTFVPTNGYIIHIDTNATVDTFTQKDINLGKIYFVHVGPNNGSFRFHVSDGRNYAIPGLFNIIVRQRKIIMNANEKLFVAPGMQQSITRSHLQASTNANDLKREYTYLIVKAPTFGQIVLEGLRQGDGRVLSFTQKQIDENMVVFNQNVPVNAPVTADRAIFNIESPNMPTLKSVPFNIEIAVENFESILSGNVIELVVVRNLQVEEGKFNVISNLEIDLNKFLNKVPLEDKLFIKLIHSPSHGVILKNGAKLQSNLSIPLRSLYDKSLVYKHDNSNTLNDSAVINIFMINGFNISIINVTLPIDIAPVNDEFPVVLNPNPNLKAIFDSKTLLTNEVLNVRDNDGLPSSIIFQIRKDGNTSKESYFRYLSKDGPIYEFTQEDINENRVYFKHKGKDLHLTYWFRVKDDKTIVCQEESGANQFEQFVLLSGNSHCTPYYPFKIEVSQLSLQLINHSTIQLPQGSFQVPISSSNLATTSLNSSPNSIIYRINKGPFHGNISIENKINQYEFSQKQIDDQLVNYVQINNSAEDFFIVDIFQSENVFHEKPIYDVNVKITTKPLIRALRPFLVAYPGQQSLISYEHLDASELAIKTNSNPVFKILSGPKYGILKMLHFGNNVLQNEEILDQFTQEDIIRNRIAYLTNKNVGLGYRNEMVIDIIHYNLSATNVQNAHGVLVVNIFSNNSDVDLNTFYQTDSYLRKLGFKFSKETMLILFTIIIALILAISLFAILRICPKIFRKPNASIHEQDSTKTLPRNANFDNCQKEHSNCSSRRQTDCSTQSSSNSGYIDPNQANVIHAESPSSPPRSNKYDHFNSQNLHERIDHFSSPLMSVLHRSEFRGIADDVSPLPPPSLYFINDSPSFHNNTIWHNPEKFDDDNKSKENFHQNCKDFHDNRDGTTATVNRSSGDGTSISNSPNCSSIKLNARNKSHDQLTNLEQYLKNNFNEQSIRDDTFCTLDNKRFQVKSSHAKFRNQYWI